MTEVSDA